ncbi:MAG: PQQ-dependent sugar dehydrogenase [Pseudomonadota bacterium]
MIRYICALGAIGLATACSANQAAPEIQPDGSVLSEDGYRLSLIAEGLEFPWALARLPDGSLLVTEREGRLRLITEDGLNPAAFSGLPDDIYVDGQGGLMGLTLDPDFADNNTVYISYAKDMGEMNTTAVISATLALDEMRLDNVTEIFKGQDRDTRFHFGGRMAFLPDGTMVIGLGDALRYMDDAQDPSLLNGKTARIHPDGSLPDDNPFADGRGHPAVYSYGHRNIQGLIYDSDRGILFSHEHGPKGGDELNVVEPGLNYGWPEVTYGINYDGTIISNETTGPGFEDPAYNWVPSIAPSGMDLVTSPSFEYWAGDLLIGALNGPRGRRIVRVDLDEGGAVLGTENLLVDLNYGYRDVLSTPEGIYLATQDFDGRIFLMQPAD